MKKQEITLTVNGVIYKPAVEARTLLSDCIRDDLGLTGTKLGCVSGKCGACTVLLNGLAVKSCMIFAIQADGADIETVEGLSDGTGLHPIQEAFKKNHAVQCGFCTPGMVMSSYALLRCNSNPTDDQIKDAISGNLCRCSGYISIIDSIKEAAGKLQQGVRREGGK
jgi:aerobic-type carbon monoxide dehydrogenase small subunit (CoxS/CutS family)